MRSAHYTYDRTKREQIIEEIGEGTVVETFVINRGHPDGPERHELTSTGIVVVYNLYTDKLITKLIARPGQIKRYYHNIGEWAPQDLLDIAYYNTVVCAYNHI